MKYKATVIGRDPSNPLRWEVHTEGLPARLAHNRVLYLIPEQFVPSEHRDKIEAGTTGEIEYRVLPSGGYHYFTINPFSLPTVGVKVNVMDHPNIGGTRKRPYRCEFRINHEPMVVTVEAKNFTEAKKLARASIADLLTPSTDVVLASCKIVRDE